MVAESLSGLVGPAVLGRIVDLVTDGAAASALTGPVLLLVAAALAEGVVGAAGMMVVARAGGRALADLREQVVERALTVPLADLERAGTGDLLARVEGDVETVSDVADDTLGDFIGDALDIALTFGGLALLDWRLALAGLTALPVQFLALRWYLRRAGPLYRSCRRRRRRAGPGALRRARRCADGAGLPSGGPACRHHRRPVGGRLRAEPPGGQRPVRTSSPARTSVSSIGMAAVLAAGFFLVRGGTVSVGEASAAALYFHRLVRAGQRGARRDRRHPAGGGVAGPPGRRGLPARRRPAAG